MNQAYARWASSELAARPQQLRFDPAGQDAVFIERQSRGGMFAGRFIVAPLECGQRQFGLDVGRFLKPLGRGFQRGPASSRLPVAACVRARPIAAAASLSCSAGELLRGFLVAAGQQERSAR